MYVIGLTYLTFYMEIGHDVAYDKGENHGKVKVLQ